MGNQAREQVLMRSKFLFWTELAKLHFFSPKMFDLITMTGHS